MYSCTVNYIYFSFILQWNIAIIFFLFNNINKKTTIIIINIIFFS